MSAVQVATSGFVGAVSPNSVSVTLTPAVGAVIGPIDATSEQVLPGGVLRVVFTVPAGTPTGSYVVSVAGQNTAATSFTSSNPSNLTLSVIQPTIAISPGQGVPGQTMPVSITGNLTHFVAGTTQATFGPGISVGGGIEGGFGPITVLSATSATANITISAIAAAGTRNVTVQTDLESATAANAFTVTPAPFTVALTGVSPAQASPLSTVQLTAGDFVGSVAPGQVSVTLSAVGGGAIIGPLPVASAQVLPGNVLRVSFVIPAGAATGIYGAAISGQNTAGTAFSSVNPSNLTLTVEAPTISVNPNQGTRGQSLPVTITGNFTHFAQGTTQASFGPGVSVGGSAEGALGPVTVMSATTATANLVISAGAPLTARDVVVQTGVEAVTLASGFAVVPAVTKTIGVNPSQGPQGATVSVTITGTNTSFVAGVSAVTFQPGITINSVQVQSPTALLVSITIPNNTPAGARDVTVTTGAEIVTAAGAFTVVTSEPELLSISPDVIRQGETATATIAGRNTNFSSGNVTASLGAGVTIQSLTVNSPTTFTATFNVANDAALGTRTLSVQSAGQTLNLVDAVTIISSPATARLVSVVPNTGQRGQLVAVTITGENTNFAQGATAISFGSGITVTSLNVSSATVLAAQIAIANDAEIGARTVTATTGSETVSLSPGFVVAGPGSGQPFTCSVNAGVPPIVRAEGLTELVGDLVIVCTGGESGRAQSVNVQLFLNTNITSRLLGSDETEALLIVDELGTLPELTGATPAVYRGRRTGQENAIVWPGVNVLAPGTGQSRLLRITNVRANASLLGASTTLVPNQITAFLSASPSQSLPLNNPQQTVAYVLPGLVFDVANCAGTQRLTNTTLAQCVAVNSTGARDLLRGTAGDMQFAVRFHEGFQTAFKPQVQAGQIPSVPGTVYNSESGFVRSTSELPYAIGGADHGTRLVARFRDVPAGVRLFVTTGPSAGSSSGVSAALVQTGANGEGGVLAQAMISFGVPATATLNCAAANTIGFPAAEIPVVNGTAIAVWQITSANPSALETATFGVAASYAPDLQNRTPAAGQVRVAGSFGPFYTGDTAARASGSLPIPRFADQPVLATAFSIDACVTHLLFPFVTNRSGFDTGIAISNTSRDPFGSAANRLQAGACAIHYFGSTENGGSAPASQRTDRPINAGDTLTFVLSSGGNYGVAGTPGFQGYIFAQCDFQYAHGFAFVTDGPVGAARVAEGYLALIVDAIFDRGSVAESLQH